VIGGRGWGQGGEMTQALYAHMNNKKIKNFKKVIGVSPMKGFKIKQNLHLYGSFCLF
jgi:hypothetical protein